MTMRRQRVKTNCHHAFHGQPDKNSSDPFSCPPPQGVNGYSAIYNYNGSLSNGGGKQRKYFDAQSPLSRSAHKFLCVGLKSQRVRPGNYFARKHVVDTRFRTISPHSLPRLTVGRDRHRSDTFCPVFFSIVFNWL